MAKKTTTQNVTPYASPPDVAGKPGFRSPRSTILNPEAYIGQYVVVHSSPTAWLGILVDVERREEAMGCTIADAGLWVQGELKEVVRPGAKMSKDPDYSHHHVAYVSIVTALQPSGSPTGLSWKAKFRGDRPGDPNNITLEKYAESTEMSVSDCAKAISNAFTAGNKGFDSLCSLVSGFADEVNFPVPAVASILLSDALSRSW